jgi:2-iminobutanoate/2-iminopropanoate deaminase/2-aminomuconate deaminase
MTTTSAAITKVDPDPTATVFMPYAPAIEVVNATRTLYLSGATAIPLYHQHPHVPEECVLPDDIVEQTHRVMRNIQRVLEHSGMTFRNVVKITEYLTDIREADAIHAVMGEYFGDWIPASTMVAVNNLSAPGARLELDMTAAG